MRKITDISYTGMGIARQKLDFYLPDEKPTGIFVYFHGGGIENGTKTCREIESIGKYFTERGLAVAAPEYRLYPTARYPEFIEDAAAAVAFVKEYTTKEYGEGVKLYVGGTSAGGYLSMMLCYVPKYLAAHGISVSEVDAFLHDAGQPTTHFNVCRERGLDQRRCIIDDAAPIYYVGEAKEYPPQLFLVSDNDREARYEQTMLMLATLRHFGYDESKITFRLMEGYRHCRYVLDFDESGVSVFAKVTYDYIKSI
jgi:acetyl esterase/lipase